jgi:hypothetical protein
VNARDVKHDGLSGYTMEGRFLRYPEGNASEVLGSRSEELDDRRCVRRVGRNVYIGP